MKYIIQLQKKLNLSVCDEDTVDLYIPVQIDEKTLKLYEDLQNSGYDLFNIEVLLINQKMELMFYYLIEKMIIIIIIIQHARPIVNILLLIQIINF